MESGGGMPQLREVRRGPQKAGNWVRRAQRSGARENYLGIDILLYLTVTSIRSTSLGMFEPSLSIEA